MAHANLRDDICRLSATSIIALSNSTDVLTKYGFKAQVFAQADGVNDEFKKTSDFFGAKHAPEFQRVSKGTLQFADSAHGLSLLKK
jgi:hypothetical protein